MITENHYFTTGKRQLYMSTYLPSGGHAGIGAVIVPPIGHERIMCYREMVNLSRFLAKNGYVVQRFDYRGEGESSGEFINTDINTRLEDITLAINYIKKYCENVWLIGFRIGALLSIMASKTLGLNKVVLCEPLFDPKKYAQSKIRANIIMQGLYFGKIVRNETGLREDLKNGMPISVYGFHVSQRLIEQMENIDVQAYLSEFSGVAQIIYFSKREAPPSIELAQYKEMLEIKGKAGIECLVQDYSWSTKKMWTPEIVQCNEMILKLLRNNEQPSNKTNKS